MHPVLRRCVARIWLSSSALLMLLPMWRFPAGAQTPVLKVDYTGSLFGYYRIEPDEVLNQRLPAVSYFLGRRAQAGASLLLGMGNNFGPEFGASVQRELNTDSPCHLEVKRRAEPFVAPEPLYKDNDRVAAAAECDNVANFLIQAGYRAVVPGREDFLYSATWLRRIALELHKISPPRSNVASQSGDANGPRVANVDQRLLMLAGNLRATSKAKAAQSKEPDASCPLLFGASLDSKAASTCVTGGITTQMDWLRRLDDSLEGELLPCDAHTCRSLPGEAEQFTFVERSIMRQSRESTPFRKQLLQNQASAALAAIPRDRSSRSLDELVAALETLSKANSYEVWPGRSCLRLAHSPKMKSGAFSPQEEALEKLKFAPGAFGKGPDAADLMSVAADLFRSIDSLKDCKEGPDEVHLTRLARMALERLLLRRIAKEEQDIGLSITGRPGESHRVLLVGVVAKETMQAVSSTNLEVDDDKDPGQNARKESAGNSPATSADDADEKPRAFNRREVLVGDPLLALTTMVRAAQQMKIDDSSQWNFDHVIVMAQMPHTEAEELGAHAQVELGNAIELPNGTGTRLIDLILSEAESEHVTRRVDLRYPTGSMVPVFTPAPAYDEKKDGLIDPVSTAMLTHRSGKHSSVPFSSTLPRRSGSLADDAGVMVSHNNLCEDPAMGGGCVIPDTRPAKTASQLLHTQLTRVGAHATGNTGLDAAWKDCQTEAPCQNSALMRYLLEQLHRSSGADVVLLERRDFFFGKVSQPTGNAVGTEESDYYPICKEWAQDHPETAWAFNIAAPDYCRLRIALDRVLWAGDYTERVMTDGKSLTGMLATAQQETTQEQTLLAQDTHQEWLLTFGIVTTPPRNLALAAMGPETFEIPGDSNCQDNSAKSDSPVYCVNAQKMTDDGAYWVATSDHLAQDKSLYKNLSDLSPIYHETMYRRAKQTQTKAEPTQTEAEPTQSKDMARNTKLYLTGDIANEIARHGQQIPRTVSPKHTPMAAAEHRQQVRPLLQLDFAKLVGGFMMRRPDLTDSALASTFVGVTETRATTPHAQELDMEAVSRFLAGPSRYGFTFGVQTDTEYDRAVVGNLTGNPETVTYALNSFTAGGFVQHRIPFPRDVRGVNEGNKELPTTSLVVAPYQYQAQITGNYLTFNYAVPPGQITVGVPRATGFDQRLGVRHQTGGGSLFSADPGSYLELGLEYTVQNNILSGLLLPGNLFCPVSPTVSLATCVKGKISVTPATAMVPTLKTNHTGGYYWDVHLQKIVYAKRISTTIETKGDVFDLPGATLPTQTRYAFTVNGSLNFTVFGNLVFSPTYSDFFYRNQGVSSLSHSLRTDNFSVLLKWYFARDAAVPKLRQLRFVGPSSIDQTKTTKLH